MTEGEEVESKESEKLEVLPWIVEEEEVEIRGSKKEINPSAPAEGNLRDLCHRMIREVLLSDLNH